jgi:hypothetical protein
MAPVCVLSRAPALVARSSTFSAKGVSEAPPPSPPTELGVVVSTAARSRVPGLTGTRPVPRVVWITCYPRFAEVFMLDVGLRVDAIAGCFGRSTRALCAPFTSVRLLKSRGTLPAPFKAGHRVLYSRFDVLIRYLPLVFPHPRFHGLASAAYSLSGSTTRLLAASASSTATVTKEGKAIWELLSPEQCMPMLLCSS